MQALEWWKLGEIDKIIEYCREDVRVTRNLYDFGKRIDWSCNAMTEGESRTVEWNAQLNRHFHFFRNRFRFGNHARHFHFHYFRLRSLATAGSQHQGYDEKDSQN